MANEAPDQSDHPEGVFGNLPGVRPGGRSPRRQKGGNRPGEAPKREAPSRRPAPVAPEPPPTATPPPDPEAASGPPPGHEREAPVPAGPGPGQRIENVEDLAWAGIAVAAQAATVGVRFASRALEAARKSVERP